MATKLLHRVTVWFRDKGDALAFAKKHAVAGRRVGVRFHCRAPKTGSGRKAA